MKADRGMAYCGLACCVCGENGACPGCRNEGCKDKEWCKNFMCCKQKGMEGCWQCDEFPCTGSMLDKMRIRSFARFIKEYGEEEIMKCLAQNEAAGIVYHYPGGLIGDYDKCSSEEDIIRMIRYGEKI